MAFPTRDQVSAGGVVYRLNGSAAPEVALIQVGEDRWQLPKGLINDGEAPEAAALREVREETGLNAELVAPLDKVEYWYVSGSGERRVRFHKFIHFYLMRYLAGSVADHDYEVNEARWVAIDDAITMLTFENEKKVVAQAKTLIEERS
jgi:8-oxo-dGTP pyrophosphatase MutT (NUDIX family)